MISQRAILVLFVAFLGMFSSPVYSQINLKTGYNFSFIDAPGLNDLISDFSESQEYSNSFPDLKWFQGFEGGVRFKGGIHALELTYQGGYQVLKAEGYNPIRASTYTDKLRFSVHTGAIGYQVSSGIFGLGTDLQFQWYKAKYENGVTSEKLKDVQEMFGFKFYLMFTLTGDNTIDLAFQPYMVLPTKNYDLEPLSNILGIEKELAQEKWIRYGLTVIFYNGEK